MMEMEQYILQAKNITKLYVHDQYYQEQSSILDFMKKKDVAIKNISIDIPAMSIVGIVGAEKSGKSTLLNVLSGETKPTSGELYFKGQRIISEELKQKVTCIVKTKIKNSNYSMTVFENVLHYTMRGCSNRDLAFQESERLIHEFDLDEYKYRDMNKMPQELKKRLFVVIGFNSHKECICFDEPYITLGEKYWEKFNEFIVALKEKKKKTVIISARSVESIKNISDKIIMMDQLNRSVPL